MKNLLYIFILATAAFGLKSCGNQSNETVKSEKSSKVEPTIAQKRAALDKQIKEITEKRRVAYEALALKTPFYTYKEGVVVYNKAEVAPSYVGGNEAMEEYLSNNLVYPSDAQKDGLEGTVFVDFIVAKDGQVINVVSSNSTWDNVDDQFSTEAIRVVSEMPNWIAGTQHKKAVYSAYSIPITFRIDD